MVNGGVSTPCLVEHIKPPVTVVINNFAIVTRKSVLYNILTISSTLEFNSSSVAGVAVELLGSDVIGSVENLI